MQSQGQKCSLLRFNSRTREGCDTPSLHQLRRLRCFNSRTREGCDYTIIRYICIIFGFNSRTREGCDVSHRKRYQGGGVSIHAPARGATFTLTAKPHEHLRFNSRTREGCDVRHLGRQGDQGGFNSRTREGCDALLPSRSRGLRLFQFTHPRGVRLVKVDCQALNAPVSIHAPARGATRLFDNSVVREKRFNSRTREGCD